MPELERSSAPEEWFADESHTPPPDNPCVSHGRDADGWVAHMPRDYTIQVPHRSLVFPVEVEEFCKRTLLLNYLETAIGLAMSIFGCGEGLCLSLESDPDANEQWVVIEVRARVTPEEALVMEERFASKLVATVPWPQRDLIRLIYDFI